MAEYARVLCVLAHPDDVDFAAAGTVAGLTDQGSEVSYCLVTDGTLGGYDPAVSRAEMASIRRAEQRAAAAIVGVSQLSFLGEADGSVQAGIELRRAITAVIRRARPELVITHSPYRNFQRVQSSHPDHLACGEATLAAVYPDARNQFCYPELELAVWTVPEVWLIGSETPDHFVEVGDQLARKRAALLSHVSQRPGMRGAGEEVDAFLADALGHNASLAGWPPGRLAEAFRRISTA
ncbi:MAG: PIG-L deacetylase family protein [Jatrophihabitans sp.]